MTIGGIFRAAGRGGGAHAAEGVAGSLGRLRTPLEWGAATFVAAAALTASADLILPNASDNFLTPKDIKTSIMDFGIAGIGFAAISNALADGVKAAKPYRSGFAMAGLFGGVMVADMGWGLLHGPKALIPGLEKVDAPAADGAAAKP